MSQAEAIARAPAGLSAALATAVGLAGLAAAMGIGRFAFTPLLPLMQGEHGLTLAQGGWLASANYLGYLAGALATVVLVPRPGASARGGLVAVALSTLAMGWTSQLVAWAVLRFVAGVASAFVLVGVSSWAMARLAAHARLERMGWVFGGVGTGILLAGLVGLAAGAYGVGAPAAWQGLGALAALVAFVTWRAFAADPASRGAPAQPPAALGRAAWTLIASYGLFGLGYIIPATFLPAAARALVPDPAVFGWAWPVFGAAALVSTVLVSVLWPRQPPRRVATVALWLMVAGVVAPALSISLPALMFSAFAVGGTFVVVTMAGLQEARRIAPAAPTRLVAAMTTAFAIGQVIGPLLVRSAGSAASAIVVPSFIAAALLVVSALAMRRA